MRVGFQWSKRRRKTSKKMSGEGSVSCRGGGIRKSLNLKRAKTRGKLKMALEILRCGVKCWGSRSGRIKLRYKNIRKSLKAVRIGTTFIRYMLKTIISPTY